MNGISRGTPGHEHCGILHVCEDVSEGEAASQQLVIAQLAGHFRDRGFRTEVLGPRRSSRTVAACLAPFVRSSIRPPFSPQALVGFWVAIGRAQAVHIHGIWSPTGIVAAAVARLRGVPYVVTPHGMLQPWLLRRRRWLKRMHLMLVGKRMVRSAAAIHCVTPREARVLRRLGAPARRIKVIPNAVPPDWPIASSAEIHRAQRNPVVLFVGRLHPVKGIDLLIEAWIRLSPFFPTWRLEIVGHDQLGLRPVFERRITDTLGNGSVSFLDPRKHAALVELYDRASVFVLPSHTEIIGMANLEAAARGVPVVTSKNTGMDLVGVYGGGVICSPTVDSISGALQRLLEVSDADRRRMGAAALRMVQDHFTWDRVAPRFDRLYDFVLERGRAEPVESES